MPEGDTIRRLADRLTNRFVGQVVESSLFRHPRLATSDLSSRTLVQSDARGKHLLLRFSGNVTLHIHLRMAGDVCFRYAREVASHRRRFEIKFESGWITGVDIPIVNLITSAAESTLIGHLGPDVCGSYDHQVATQRYAALARIPIAQAMLDQRIVAGFGNIYAVETPFLVGIHPAHPASDLSGVAGLLTLAVGLIRTNARYGPQNTTGRDIRRTDHWVLSRKTEQCRVCGGRVRRRPPSQTAWQRRTAWCENCQPETATTVNLSRAAELLKLHPCRRIIDIAHGELLVDTSRPVATEVSET